MTDDADENSHLQNFIDMWERFVELDGPRRSLRLLGLNLLVGAEAVTSYEGVIAEMETTIHGAKRLLVMAEERIAARDTSDTNPTTKRNEPHEQQSPTPTGNDEQPGPDAGARGHQGAKRSPAN